MASTTKNKALEFFVEGFIRTHTRASVKTRHIQAAIDLIDTKLALNELIQLHLEVSKRNVLPLAVMGILNNMTKKNNVDSITRAKTALTAFKNS